MLRDVPRRARYPIEIEVVAWSLGRAVEPLVRTAAPVSRRIGKEIVSYDPRKLADFAAQLRHSGGRHLVVGHSNTTPSQ